MMEFRTVIFYLVDRANYIEKNRGLHSATLLIKYDRSKPLVCFVLSRLCNF